MKPLGAPPRKRLPARLARAACQRGATPRVRGSGRPAHPEDGRRKAGARVPCASELLAQAQVTERAMCASYFPVCVETIILSRESPSVTWNKDWKFQKMIFFLVKHLISGTVILNYFLLKRQLLTC